MSVSLNILPQGPTLPHPSSGLEFNIYLIFSEHLLCATQQQWVRQPRSLPGVHIPQGSFSFVEFELQLIFQNCQLADSNLFSLLYSTFSWVAMSLWPKRLSRKCWGLWESSPISFASSCLKQECGARSCDRLSAIVRKGPRESQRYQLTALTSLNYWTDITNYLTPHSCHVRNISPYWLNTLLVRSSVTCSWKYS